jgi:type II secretory pathway pseudopilin PulG
MLVIVIIGALAAMVVPRLASRLKGSQMDIARADIKGNLSLALKLYAVDNSGAYPSSSQGLKALIEKVFSHQINHCRNVVRHIKTILPGVSFAPQLARKKVVVCFPVSLRIARHLPFYFHPRCKHSN